MNNANELLKYGVKALISELTSAKIYRKLAEMYKESKVSNKLIKIAEMEERHASFWTEFLKRRGVDVSKVKVSCIKVNLLALLFRIIGLSLALRVLEASERDAVKLYSQLLSSKDISEEERKEILRILEDELVHEYEFMEEESRFKELLNHIRDAVLGMSDGLVEVLSVSAGLAGVYGNPFNVAIGGCIVGIAGALSMGIGAFTSVRAQKQVRMGVLGRVRAAAIYASHILATRLIEYIKRKGLSEKVAKDIANESLQNTELLSKMIAEEEYGLREEVLENPGKAGLYTGIFYIIGAIVPLIPYFIQLSITIALPLSFILAAVMLALTGFIIAVSANLNIKLKMIELVIAGLGSATITFLIGRLASLLLGIEVS